MNSVIKEAWGYEQWRVLSKVMVISCMVVVELVCFATSTKAHHLYFGGRARCTDDGLKCAERTTLP